MMEMAIHLVLKIYSMRFSATDPWDSFPSLSAQHSAQHQPHTGTDLMQWDLCVNKRSSSFMLMLLVGYRHLHHHLHLHDHDHLHLHHHLHYHHHSIDAGAAFVCPEHRYMLKGIEYAGMVLPVTIHQHKISLPITISISIIITNVPALSYR